MNKGEVITLHNQPDSQSQLAREKALYRYISAFENNDSDTMSAVLQQAMFDPLLDEMITETHEYYLSREKTELSEEHFSNILRHVSHYLSSNIPGNGENLPLILDDTDTFARLGEDKRNQGLAEQELLPSTKLPQTNFLSMDTVKNISYLDFATSNDEMLSKNVRGLVGKLDFWDSFLTHQLRVLLYAEPLLVLRNQRLPEMEHYDALSLALKLFHQIIEHTGLEHEIDSASAINLLFPLLLAMDQAKGIEPDQTRHRRMVDWVLATLRNDKESQRAFKIHYTDFENGHATERILAVRLLEERYHSDGHIVLGLSNELTNLLLNALTIDIEDAQAATEAIIQSQLARGRFYEAINSARQARFHSIRLHNKIERILADTKRDIRRVDWKAEVPRVLSEALEHIDMRCSVEVHIANSARTKRETLDIDSEEVRQLSEIIALVEDCRQRHMELQQQLSGARSIFFNEQERQSFALRTSAYLPNLYADVLEPLLKAPRLLAETATKSTFPLCTGANTPHVFSLSLYIAHQIQPKREKSLETVLEEERELGAIENDQPFYSPEVMRLAEAHIASLKKPVRIEEVLQKAIERAQNNEVIELLALLILRHFAPQETDNLAFTVHKVDEEQFVTGGISGDNVLLVSEEDLYVQYE